MSRTLLLSVGGIHVFGYDTNSLIAFESGLNIDADGSPRAYNPTPGVGLDYIDNAGGPGNWWALVTNKKGQPIVQGEDDPAPGFYISTTSLEDGTKGETDPARYVDSEKIPFVALPPRIKSFYKLGDIGYAYNKALKVHSWFIFADIGPGNNLGEGSIKLAENLGINSNPKHGGISNGIFFLLFPGSGNGKPKTENEINSAGQNLIAAANTNNIFTDFDIV